MAQQKKLYKAIQSIIKEVRENTIKDVTEYIKYEKDITDVEDINVEDILSHFNDIDIKENVGKKGKTSNYHKFMKVKTDEFKMKGFTSKESQTKAREIWSTMSPDQKKEYNQDQAQVTNESEESEDKVSEVEEEEEKSDDDGDKDEDEMTKKKPGRPKKEKKVDDSEEKPKKKPGRPPKKDKNDSDD